MLPIDAQIFRSLFEWVGNSATADDIQNLKSTLSRLSPEQKFQVLSTSLQALPRSYQLQLSLEAYLLHEIIYRICDPRLDPVEGRDPGLIGCFLSGLSDDQKISLFTKVDYNRNTPL